jgi:hypothetical protein
MEQNLLQKLRVLSYSRYFCILWKASFHFHVLNRQRLSVSCTKWIQSSSSLIFNIRLNILPSNSRSTRWSHSFAFPAITPDVFFFSATCAPHPAISLHVFLDFISQKYIFSWHRYLLLSMINVQVTFCWFSPYGFIFSCPLLRVDQNILINERKRQLCGLNTASQMKHAYCGSIFPRPAVTSFSWPWQHNCLINPHTMGRNFIFCTLFRISEPLKSTKRWV